MQAVQRSPAGSIHGRLDDLQALATGSLLAAVALLLFQQAGLVPGGTVGLALLLHAVLGWDAAASLLAANAPFYLLGFITLGRGFTGRTVAAVLLTSVLAWMLPQGLVVAVTSPWLAGVVGGALCGLAMLVLFRHGSSLGGLNILALLLQRRFGWRPASVQLAVDAAIVAAGALAADGAARVGASLLAVATLNLVIAMNHRPGRYVGTTPGSRP